MGYYTKRFFIERSLPPSFLLDGNTVAWYDFKNNVEVDGSNRISKCIDLTGNNRHLLQSNDSYKPLLTSDGAYFDGTDDYMRATGFTYAQPFTVYFLLHNTSSSGGEYFFDGGAAASTVRMNLYSPVRIFMYSSTVSYIEGTTQLSVGLKLWCCRWNGASSVDKVYYGSNLASSGRTAGSLNNSTPNGITVAAAYGLSTNSFMAMYAKEMIIRKVADSETTDAEMRIYFKNKWGY